ncbi:MAG: ATP-binding protein, partial [Spirochaetales bacterium]|nr:ATP-binding protein [Candidatus Physcosoma equi]
LVKKANFKYPKIGVNCIDYLPERHLNKDLILNLATCNFLEYATDVTIYGETGSGKSYLACALGKAACMRGKRTIFYRMQDLLLDYDCIDSPLQKKKFLTKMARYDLLIIDEWLGSKLSEAQLSFIYELVEKRTEVHSTIFCGQFAPKDWYARLGASSMTESIVNRILSGLCKVDCGDFNMREHLSKLKMII